MLSPSTRPRSSVQSSTSSKVGTARSSRSRTNDSNQSVNQSTNRTNRLVSAAPFDPSIEQAELAALQASIVFPPANNLEDVKPSINQSIDQSINQSISTPRLRFETFHSKVDYRFDGDRSMDTDSMIAKRRRLKQDQSIQTWINVFWRTFHHKSLSVNQSINQNNDSDSESSSDDEEKSINQSVNQSIDESPIVNDPFASPAPICESEVPLQSINQSINQSKARFSLGGSISRTQYLLVHKLWFKALHKLYDRSDAHIQSIKDWTRDSWLSINQSSLDHSAFTDSLFELIDLWTLTVEPQEYVHFLATLYHRVTRVKTWLADDGSILTKYIWKKTKYVKPSAVYRPYQYNKYKNVAWKSATEVIHHFYSDSENESEEMDDDGIDDAVIHDLTMLSDDEPESNNQSTSESEDLEFDSDENPTPSEHRHSSSRSQRQGRRHSINQSINQTINLTGEKPILPLLMIDQSINQSLPDVNTEPPQSPYLDPPACIPETPSNQSARDHSENEQNDDFDDSDSDNDMHRLSDSADLLNRKDQKAKAKLETAFDVLNQRRQDRMLKMLSKFTKLLDKQHVTLRRSNSVLVFDGHGGLSSDVDPRFKSINQSVNQSTNQPINQSTNRSCEDSDVNGIVDAEDDPRYQSIKQTINQSIKRGINHRRQSCPFDIAAFSCLPPRWLIETHRPNLTGRSINSAVSRNAPSLDSDSDDYDEEDSRVMSAQSINQSISQSQSRSRPATVDMQQDDFEAYMASLQADMRPNQSIDDSFDNQSNNQSINQSNNHSLESTVVDLPPHPDDPHEMMQAPMTPMTEDNHPPSSAINQSTNQSSPFQHHRLVNNPPSPVFSHSQRLASPLAKPKKKIINQAISQSKVNSPALVSMEIPIIIDEPSTVQSINQSIESVVEEPEELHLHPASEEKSTNQPINESINQAVKPKKRSSHIRSPEPSINQSTSQIRDEALAAEYDEARGALKSQMKMMREIDEDELIPPPTADESRANTGEVRNDRHRDDGGISLSMRLAAAQAERAKAAAAAKPVQPTSQSINLLAKEDSKRRADEDASKAEQELFSLLHEAEEQRRIEALLKAQKREIAKKEKEARRKFRGDHEPDHNADHDDRRNQSVNDHQADCKKKDNSSSGAARDAAARRRAEKNEEEQARLQSIKERQDAEAAKAELLRSKTDKHVLKAKSKPKKDDSINQSLPPLAEDEEGGVKVRPDFLKARRHDDDHHSDDDQSVNESTNQSSEESTERSNLTSTAESTARSSIQSSPVSQSVEDSVAIESSPVKAAKTVKGKASTNQSINQSKTGTPSKPLRRVSKKSNDENQTSSEINQSVNHPIKKKKKKHHSSDDESDNEHESEADLLIRLEEEKKFGFGQNWSIEQKRAYREKELFEEKNAQRLALAKTGELGLIEMRWASTRDKIQHDEARAELLAEQQRQIEELEKQKLIDRERKIAEKEREMIEREAAKIRKAELEEANKRLAAEKREARMNQAADRAANKQTKDHSTTQSTERSTRRHRAERKPKQMIEAEDRPSNARPSVISRSTDARAMNSGTIVKRSEATRVVKVVEPVASTINSDANRAVDAAADRKRELIAKRREEAQKRVADQQRLRDMRAEELRESAVKQAASQKKPPQHYLTADEVRQRQQMKTPEQRESTADRNSATEKAPFFRPVPARRTIHASDPPPVLVAAEDERGRLVEAQVDPRDDEIKYWMKATLEEQPLSPRTFRAPLSHRDNSVSILADSAESVKADLAALRAPPQRGWGLALAKETEPTVVEAIHVPIQLSHDQEAHDWQLASARRVVAPLVDVVPGEVAIEDVVAVEPPLSARPMHVPVARVERPRDEPLVMEQRIEPVRHQVRQVAHIPSPPHVKLVEDVVDEPTYPTDLEAPFARTVKQVEVPKHVVDMHLAEAAQRKADIDEQTRAALDHSIYQSEAARNEANARRAQYMVEFMEHTRMRNAAKVKRKTELDEQSIIQYIEMREAMNQTIKDWQMRKNELFYASEEIRRDRAVRKQQQIELSRQRQEEHAYQANQLIETRRRLMQEKEERRRRRVAEREAFLHAKQLLNKQREQSATEKRLADEEIEAEQRRVDDDIRAKHEHQQIEQWKLREAARIEESERIKRAAREYREKIARDNEIARLAELDRIEKHRKDCAKASVMAVLNEMQATASAEAESQRVIEELKLKKEQEITQLIDLQIRECHKKVLSQLIDYHNARQARQKAINQSIRRQQLEYEQRRKEEVVVMRVSRNRLNQAINHSTNQSAIQSNNQSINRSISQSISKADPTPFITQQGATFQSIDQPINQSINQPVDLSKSFSHPLSSTGDQSINQSNNVLFMAKRAMAQYLTQQHFSQSVSQPISQSINQSSEEESKVELIILGDQTDRPATDSNDRSDSIINQSINQSVESISQLSDESISQSINHLSDELIDRAIARYESPLKPRRRLDPQVARSSTNQSINQSKKSYKQPHELLISGSLSHQTINQSFDQPNNQAINQSINKRAKPHRPPTKYSVNQSISQSTNSSHLWGNNEEQFSLVGQKQRAFIRNSKTVMLPSINQSTHQSISHSVKQQPKPASRSAHRSLPALSSSARTSPRSLDSSINHSINQSTNQSTNQSIDPSELIVSSKPSSAARSDAYTAQLPPLIAAPFLINQSTNQSVDQSLPEMEGVTDQSINQLAESINQSINQPLDDSTSHSDQPDASSVPVDQPQSINQLLEQSVDLTPDQSISPLIDQSIDQSIAEPTSQSIDVAEDDETVDTFDAIPPQSMQPVS